MPRGRKLTLGIDRPPCPLGHSGTVLLDGHRKIQGGAHDKQRYICVPDDGSGRHKFSPSLPARRSRLHGSHRRLCLACQRPYQRNDGVPTARHFVFAVKEQASILDLIGKGQSFRAISRAFRSHLGRPSLEAHLAMDYLDVFGPIVIGRVAEQRWPLVVQLDAKPLRRRIHRRRPRPTGVVTRSLPWPQSLRQRRRSDRRKRGKLRRQGRIPQMGRILVATGADAPGRIARPVLMRFAGAGDEEGWFEFLDALRGEPAYVVSDRDQAIIAAVKRRWPTATHYFCEQHLAHNAELAARRDRVFDQQMRDHIERSMWEPGDWAAFEQEVRTRRAPNLQRWMAETAPLVAQQFTVRRAGFPRSAGATEGVIARLTASVIDRRHVYRNAERLNRVLALICADLAGHGGEERYTRILRAWLRRRDGRVVADWRAEQDRHHVSSIDELIADAEQRQHALHLRRNAASGVGRRIAHGAPLGRRLDVPSRTPADGGSVAGTFVADYPRLAAEWDVRRNPGRTTETTPAGSGTKVNWKCPAGPDHEWAAPPGSRTLRGSNCPFCTHRRVALSGSLATTHPEVAACWHSRNGALKPTDVTCASQREVWWQCPRYKTHVFTQQIRVRVQTTIGCRTCAAAAGKPGRPRQPRLAARSSAA